MNKALLKAGIEPDPVIEAYKKDVDCTLIRENLKLTVAERFRMHAEVQRFVVEMHRAGERARREKLQAIVSQ